MLMNKPDISLLFTAMNNYNQRMMLLTTLSQSLPEEARDQLQSMQITITDLLRKELDQVAKSVGYNGSFSEGFEWPFPRRQ